MHNYVSLQKNRCFLPNVRALILFSTGLLSSSSTPLSKTYINFFHSLIVLNIALSIRLLGSTLIDSTSIQSFSWYINGFTCSSQYVLLCNGLFSSASSNLRYTLSALCFLLLVWNCLFSNMSCAICSSLLKI